MKMIHIAKSSKAQAVQKKKVNNNQKDVKANEKTVSFNNRLVKSEKKNSQKTAILKNVPLLKGQEKSLIKKNSKKITELNLKADNKKNNKAKSKKSDELNASIAGSLQVKENIENKDKIKESQIQAKENVEIASSKENVKEVKKEVNADNHLSGLLTGINKKADAKQKNNTGFEPKTDKKPENKLKVKDFRSKNKSDIENPREVQNQNNNLNVQNQEQVQNENSIEVNSEKAISLGTTEISAEGEGGKAQAPVMKEASSLIKQQLKDFGNNEIVKQSRFILKDNNVGEIKLILKPESLGEVKINLNLNDSNLSGQIIVENSIAKEVFEDNMPSLSKALEEKGFDTANLDVSLSDKEKNNQRQNGKNKQYFSERLKKFEKNGQVVRYGLPTAGINLTA